MNQWQNKRKDTKTFATQVPHVRRPWCSTNAKKQIDKSLTVPVNVHWKSIESFRIWMNKAVNLWVCNMSSNKTIANVLLYRQHYKQYLFIDDYLLVCLKSKGHNFILQ